MVISYRLFEEFPGWDGAPDFFKSLLTEYACTRVLEIGSGANPTLAPDYVRDNSLPYVTSDLSQSELEKVDPAFERLVLDLSARNIDSALDASFDCILSRMVGEHVRDGQQLHRNIFKMLRPGGISAHCFSTLWAFPFVINRLLPDSITDQLLSTFAPRDEHRHAKFKAYYSWSRGPSAAMIRRFADLGFEVVRYTGYFGHAYYRQKLSVLEPLEKLKSRLLLRHPVPQLCSYATLVLRKPK